MTKLVHLGGNELYKSGSTSKRKTDAMATKTLTYWPGKSTLVTSRPPMIRGLTLGNASLATRAL